MTATDEIVYTPEPKDQSARSPEQELLETVRTYLSKWQPRLRLMDWDIWVTIEKVDDNHAAESSTEWRMRRGRLIFPSNFIEKSRDCGEHPPEATDAEIIEHTVVHELLHIAEQPVADRVSGEITWLVGTHETGTVFGAELRNSWRDYREWWINHLTRALMDADRTGGWTHA